MEAGNFIVLHTRGATWVNARSAAEALRLCPVPGGYRHARAVIAAAFTASSHITKPQRDGSPFVAFIGAPVRLAERKESAA
jgi:hypothetical protein